jgi:glycosyltransferase involved in cell wall biosynthesis
MWMREQGPDLPELSEWLQNNCHSYDAAIFFTYLYQTTYVGLPIAARYLPTMLHPTAHDEPPFYLGLFELTVRHADVLGYLTEEEAELVERRFRLKPRSCLVGIGTEIPEDDDAGISEFLREYALEESPYLLYLGRVDPSKGTDELNDYFLSFKRTAGSPTKLVMMGEPVKPPAPHDDLIITGFVPERVRTAALRGATALVHPSRYESFSMVLTEAWAVRRPALVQGANAVLRGQIRRSGGGLTYETEEEFKKGVVALMDGARGTSLGDSGYTYVRNRYDWKNVLDRYERQLELLRSRRPISLG